jgi:SAM-dependent methyltransferase
MDAEIIGTASHNPGLELAWQTWWGKPKAQGLLDWEQQVSDACLGDVFGFYALQLGRVPLQGLRNNRMPFQWLASPHGAGIQSQTGGPAPKLMCDPRALPFAEYSLDLLVLAHALDGLDQPLAALREAHRVLVPEGRLLVFGLNPWGPWGLRQRAQQVVRRWGRQSSAPSLLMPSASLSKMCNWLSVLGFADIKAFGSANGTPFESSEPWRALRSAIASGNAYAVWATKRVNGTKALYTRRQIAVPLGKAPVPVATQNPHP